MKRELHQLQAQQIVDFFPRNNNERKVTIEHFLRLGVPNQTIKNVLRRYNDTGSALYKPISGRKVVIRTPEAIKKVKNDFRRNRSMSVRVSANKLKLTPTTL